MVLLRNFITIAWRVLTVGVEDVGMARTPYRIELGEGEERELRGRAGQYTRAYREVLRAKIVLLAAEGLANAEIARRLDTTREAVSRWRKRFHDERLQGLGGSSPFGPAAALFPPKRWQG